MADITDSKGKSRAEQRKKKRADRKAMIARRIEKVAHYPRHGL